MPTASDERGTDAVVVEDIVEIVNDAVVRAVVVESVVACVSSRPQAQLHLRTYRPTWRTEDPSCTNS